MPRSSRTRSSIAVPAGFLMALALAILAGPAPALAADTVVFRDHGDFYGEADEPNICGWPAHFSGHITYQLMTVDAGGGTFHVTYHQTDNWTLVIADDPSVPASVRGETWRGRNEINYVLNVDPLTQRVVEITLNPNAEGPFRGLLERITLVVGADGSVRVDSHEFVGDVDCSVFV